MVRIDSFTDAILQKMKGPRPPKGYASDGCSRVPDAVPGLQKHKVSVSLACLYHDFHYNQGGTEQLRRQADAWFLENMLELGADPVYALLYYRGVRVFGVFGHKYGWQYFRKPWFFVRFWYFLKALICG